MRRLGFLESEAFWHVARKIGRAEEPIPDGEADGVVEMGGAMVGVDMVPGVKRRRVEDVFKEAKGETEVGVGEMADEGAENGAAVGGLGGDADEGGGEVENELVGDDFEPVEAPVAEPVHLFGAVMDAVEMPESGYAVHEVMHEPLKEVFYE